MKESDINAHRISRLEAAVDHVSNGNRTAFGKRLGYSDGAFVRQMLSGLRPITEKTIRAVEALPNMRDWFSVNQPFQTHALREPAVEYGSQFFSRVDREAFFALTEAQRQGIEDWVVQQVQNYSAAPQLPAKSTSGKAA